jgi:hypothetical protein
MRRIFPNIEYNKKDKSICVHIYENDNFCSFLEKRFGNEFVIVDYIINLTKTLEEFFKSID